LNKLNQLLRSL